MKRRLAASERRESCLDDGLKREGTFDNAAGKAKKTVDKAADKAGLPR